MWRRVQDSNLRRIAPRVFETRAIGRYANPPLRAREESNLQPPGPQPGVLSIELRALLASIIAFWSSNYLFSRGKLRLSQSAALSTNVGLIYSLKERYGISACFIFSLSDSWKVRISSPGINASVLMWRVSKFSLFL